ncbi:MAG: hypothetical protein HOP29_18880 [Phycisphaerales bacterium]|nr:hypothetical protein [Phycisphaerales bacterium]
MLNLIPLLLAVGAMVAAIRQMPDLAEDTFIIARYATHVANGDGYVWNIGEPPSDGVTELLPMLLAAGLIRLGLDPRTALVAIATVATVCVTIIVSRRVPGSSRPPSPGAWLLAILVPYCSSLPILSAMGYGTATYCLLLVAGGAVAGRLIERFRWHEAAGLGLVMFLAGAARPEGVLIGGTLVVGLLAVARRPVLTSFLHGVCFAAPLAIYLWVRFRYFGDVFPNTYYVKRGAEWLNLATLSDLGDYWSSTIAPFALLILLGVGFADRIARRTLALIFVVFVVVQYAFLVRFEFIMNWYDRFEQPVLVMAMFSAGMALDVLYARISETAHLPVRARRGLAAGIAAVMAAYPVLWTVRHALTRDPNVQDKTVREDREIAEKLRDYADRGYTMLVSEAGLVPFVSEWRHIDPYGLTDGAIARHGLTFARMESEAPEIVMYHAPAYMTGVHQKKDWFPGWLRMTRTLREFVERADYDFVGVVPRNGSAESGEHYYVKRSCPDSDAFKSVIAPYVLSGASIDPPQRQNHQNRNNLPDQP